MPWEVKRNQKSPEILIIRGRMSATEHVVIADQSYMCWMANIGVAVAYAQKDHLSDYSSS